jgi:hypothetical protein
MFIGADNYTATRICGKHVRDVVPDGGEILVSVGTLDESRPLINRPGDANLSNFAAHRTNVRYAFRPGDRANGRRSTS